MTYGLSRWRSVWGAAAFSLLVAGCGNQPAQSAKRSGPAGAKPSGATASGTRAPVKTAASDSPAKAAHKDSTSAVHEDAAPVASAAKGAVVDAAGLKQLVAQQHGKVVYLDFWATWCAPCVKGLPELAKLQHKYGDRGLQVIAVSFDDPDDWQRKAVPTLAKAGWTGPAVVMADRDAQNAVVDWLGDDWRSELPARYLLDRNGKRAYEITMFSSADLPPLDTMIEKLLK